MSAPLKPLFVAYAIDRHDRVITWAASTNKKLAHDTILSRAQHKLDLGLVTCPVQRTTFRVLHDDPNPTEAKVLALLKEDA